MTTSLEEHAAMRLSGRLVVPLDCTCEEYATVIVDQAIKVDRQAEEIKRLKEKLRIIQEIIDANKIEMVSEELCQGRSNL